MRKKKGLSQSELDEKVGINTAHLSRLENGRYQPSVEVLKKWLIYFGKYGLSFE
jgi:transcriptional regulator with XRE-family HTH domain